MRTVKLNFPFNVDGKEITELKCRRLTVGDRRKAVSAYSSEVEQEIALVGYMTGLNPEDVDMIDAGDYSDIQEVLTDFLTPVSRQQKA